MKTDCLDESTSGSDSHEARAFHNCIVSHVYTRSVQYSPMINDAPIGVHHDIDGVIKFIDRHPYPSLSGQEYICHSTIGSNSLPPAKQMRRRLMLGYYICLLMIQKNRNLQVSQTWALINCNPLPRIPHSKKTYQ